MTSSVAIVFLKNNQGRFLAHQRAATKRVYPLLWGLGAGGKVDAGESVAQAAAREMEEELGLPRSFVMSGMQFVCEFDFEDKSASIHHRLHVFVLQIVGNETLQPCKREFQQTKWMTFDEVSKLVNQHELCPDTEQAFHLVHQQSSFFDE